MFYVPVLRENVVTANGLALFTKIDNHFESKQITVPESDKNLCIYLFSWVSRLLMQFSVELWTDATLKLD